MLSFIKQTPWFLVKNSKLFYFKVNIIVHLYPPLRFRDINMHGVGVALCLQEKRLRTEIIAFKFISRHRTFKLLRCCYIYIHIYTENAQ